MKDNITQLDQSRLKNLLREINPEKNFFIIDENVYQLYNETLNLDHFPHKFFLKNPEQDKNLQKYEECVSHFIEEDIRRDCTIWALGGGATSDFAGFVAATTFRGIQWKAIPTTLLSMVDASVGGKVALNTKHAKNLIGFFHLPEMVYLNFDFIETLPRSEYESGLGEVIKYCFLSTDINGLVKRDAPMSDIIWACVKFKMEVTQKDLRDNADRRILNLGHTIGHAFERTNDLPHGIAVVLGIYHSLKSFNHSLLNELYSFMQRFNMAESLLFTMPTDEEQFWKYVSKDKKIMGHTINFVVAKSVGYSIVEQISPEELRNKISFK